MSEIGVLSWIVFLPALAAAIIMVTPKIGDSVAKTIALVATILTFLATLSLICGGQMGLDFEKGVSGMQALFSAEWIPTFNIYYMMGMDGISFPLVVLTSFVSLLAMGASWNIKKHVKAYCILFLLLETGMLGVFLSLDFFLFYVFWEVMLLPMYFLIGVWGGPRREYAAMKFFLYTLFGSVLMLIAILLLYFHSDLRALDQEQLVTAGVISRTLEESDATKAFEELKQSSIPQHTFNILALQQMGQHTDLFDGFGVDQEGEPVLFLGKGLQWWAFVLLLVGFIIKVPSVPVHTWLPDAHVEAPTPISMILAGVLLKMGGYGIIRICYPICPDAGYELAWFVCGLGVVSMVYGAFSALAQKDFKRMVAYSSVSHMGYVLLGIGVWTATSEYGYNPTYWEMGMNGAMFQMIAHGISSAGMFFMVGVVYDRVHHRNLNEFGGLFAKMPVYSGLAMGIFFAGLGLPGLCGFIGEFLVVASVWSYSVTLLVISAAVVILTAAYILWAIQRVYLGAEYKGPHEESLTPITARELSIAVPLLGLAILFGVYPRLILDYMEPSVNQTVQDLATWTQNHDIAEAEKSAGEDKKETANVSQPAKAQQQQLVDDKKINAKKLGDKETDRKVIHDKKVADEGHNEKALLNQVGLNQVGQKYPPPGQVAR